MTQCVSVYSCFTAKLKSGPRRQFGPRRSPERFWRFHRVIGPIRPYGNTHLHLGRSFGKTGYVVNGNFCCINRYTRTRIASRPSRAIQLYIAIQCYTLYSYTSLYSIQPLQHPSGRMSWSRLGQRCRMDSASSPGSNFSGRRAWRLMIPGTGHAPTSRRDIAAGSSLLLALDLRPLQPPGLLEEIWFVTKRMAL